MNYMFLPLRRYFDFQGRSRRMEYWMWFLFQFIVSIIINAIFFGTVFTALMRLGQSGGYDIDRYDSSGEDGFETGYRAGSGLGPEVFFQEIGTAGLVLLALAALWGLFTFIPNLAVTIRRLHDSNRTGWWVLAPLAPYVLLVLGVGMSAAVPDLAPVGAILGIVSLLALLGFAVLLLVFMFLDGTPGPNRFGPNPKGEGYESTFR